MLFIRSLLILSFFLINACGQRGPLVQPSAEPQKTTSAHKVDKD